MEAVYMGNGRVLAKLAWGGILLLDANDLSLTPLLVAQGSFEVPLTKFFMQNITRGDTVIDVGAHVGYFTVLLASLVGEKGHVTAYEANPQVYGLLRDNVALNYLTPQTACIPKAVYSSSGQMEFHVTERFNCNSSLRARPDDYLQLHQDRVSKISVETTSLAGHFTSGQRIRAIKLDIEGGEYQAFVGMQDALMAGMVDWVAFEWAPTMLREETEPFCEMLRHLFRTYTVGVPTNEGGFQAVSLEDVRSATWIPSVLLRNRRLG